MRDGDDGTVAESRVRVHAERSARTVFCGHTPLPGVIGAHGTWWIDTAGGGTLTCVDALSLERFEVPIADGGSVLTAATSTAAVRAGR